MLASLSTVLVSVSSTVEPETATSVTGLLTSLLVTVKAELSGIAVELSGSS